MKPFPPLPVELVRGIMETAAEWDTDTSRALVLVSALVHKWIIPSLYHTVTIEDQRQAQSFKDALCAHGAHVRRLFFGFSPLENADVAVDIFADIVCGCSRLEVLCADVEMVSAMTEATSFPNPWMVMLIVENPPVGHPLLRNVTHLYLDYMDETSIGPITALPRLTHFGVGCWGDEEEPEYTSWVNRLLSFPSLRILLLCAYTTVGVSTGPLIGERWHELANITDVRLLVRYGLGIEDYMDIVISRGTMWDYAASSYKDWREGVIFSESPLDSPQ